MKRKVECTVRTQWKDKLYQLKLPTFWSVVGPAYLCEGHKAGSGYSQKSGHENNHLHGRKPGYGTNQRGCRGTHGMPDFPAEDLRIYN